VLHNFPSLTTGHFLPPLRALEITFRLRYCTPVPHDFEHLVQEEKLVVTQSAGHLASFVQLFASLNFGHTLPPFAARRVINLLRVRVPTPQDLEHEDH
jgi:hypothetical protein